MEAPLAPCGVAFTETREAQAAAGPLQSNAEASDGRGSESISYFRIPTTRAKPLELMVGAAGFEPTTP